ncbi:MAG TPA: hypothetical protein VD772_12010, partial [Anseongella sp.]|nr:hypothetical protein [Anseongella sp.]
MKGLITTIFFLACISAAAQIPVDRSGLDRKSGVELTQEGSLLNVSWPAGNMQKGRISISLEKGTPLLNSISLGEGTDFREIAEAIDPAFLLTVGKRNLDVERNDTKLGWTIFFDNTPASPFETYPVKLEKQSVEVLSEGTRT